MVQIPRPTPEQKVRIRGEMGGRALLSAMLKTGEPGAVTPAELFRYANGSLAYPNIRIDDALSQQPGLRASFRRMVESISPVHFEPVVAASDREMPERRGEGCKISFENSQAETDRIYVVISLDEWVNEVTLSRLVLFARDGLCHQFPVPPARRGVIQLLTEKDARLTRLLSDPMTEVFLR